MIPKIIHHVWPCDEEPFDRPEFVAWRELARSMHPDFEFKFWRPSNLLYIEDVLPDVRKVLEDPEIPIVPKADVMRWEIIRLAGGLYLDTDIECLKPLDDLFAMDRVFIKSGKNTVWMMMFGMAVGDPLALELSVALSSHVLANRDEYVAGRYVQYNDLVGKIVTDSGCDLLPAWTLLDGSMNEKEQAARIDKALVIHHASGSWPGGWRKKVKYGITRKD
jgi:inositol phosphorylceramide mannosyltransferase catalytic subunit